MRNPLKYIKALLKALALKSRVNHVLVRILPFPIVLGYHRIIDLSDSLLVQRIGAVRPDEFARHLAYFEDIGCRFENFHCALATSSSRSVAITFDDGFRDLFTNAFPTLSAHKAPFTLFLITSLIDRSELLWQHRFYDVMDAIPAALRREALAHAVTRVLGPSESIPGGSSEAEDLIRFVVATLQPDEILSIIDVLSDGIDVGLTATQLYLASHEVRTMLDRGLSIESHGHEHWVLTNLSPIDLLEEIAPCANLIEQRFGNRPRAYAVAHGVSNDLVLGEIERQGYRSIVIGRNGLYSKPGSREVPRIWPCGSEVDLSWMLTRVLISTALRSIFARISISPRRAT